MMIDSSEVVSEAMPSRFPLNMAFMRRRGWILLIAFGYLFLAFHFMTSSPDCPTDSGVDLTVNRYEDIELELNPRMDQVGPIVAPRHAPEGDKAPITAPKPQQNIMHEAGDDLKHSQHPPSPQKHVYTVDKLPHHQLLHSKLAPNSVFWVWCGARWFEFHHYLSVLSVIKELRPDNAVFYYDKYPVQDYWLYNTWFDEIKNAYPFFRPQLLNPSENACTDHMKPNMTFISGRLTFSGGMYISEHTMLTDFPFNLRNLSFVDALDTASGYGFLLSAGGLPGQLTLKQTLLDIRFQTKKLHCSTTTAYINMHPKPVCVNLRTTFFPKDIWELNNDFGRLARRVFYGTPEVQKPKQNFDELIPNIAHIAWIGGGEMDYLFYICVLSLLYVAEVDMLYIHGNGPPMGKYWDSVKDHPRLQNIYRETPGDVYGTRVNVLSHVTDVWRVDFMIKYGGIYVDTDTIWVRPLDREIRAYDAVGSYDWTYWNPPFPDTINFGVAIGKRNAPYWREFQDSMKWFIDSDWSWNGLRQPYRIKERKPESVLIDPHLQVICFNYLCHPTWWPDYHNESIHHMNTPSLPNWRQDAYAYHLTLPTPPELMNPEALMASNTIFAQMGKYVLEKAGRLPLIL